jgi:hypothetical protein
MGGIYELAVEMGSGAMIHIPSFIQIGSRTEKLVWGTQEAWGSHKPIIGKSAKIVEQIQFSFTSCKFKDDFI